MPQTRALLDSLTPRALGTEVLAPTVDALSDCEEAVTVCAAAMLAEEDIDEFRPAVVHDLNCADVVMATRRVLSRGADGDAAMMGAQLEACVIACRRSHETCSRHAHHDHCRLCAEATSRAADACNRALAALRA